jgi:predicted nucleotidyltransferase
MLPPLNGVGRTLPHWLARKYFTIISTYGYLPFTVKEAASHLKSSRYPASILLAKMASYGWLDRLDRGLYRAVPPLIALMEASGHRWRDRIQQREKLPILELVVARLFEELGPMLESLILFGSLARGAGRPGSDIDLLVVAEGLPERFSDRLQLINRAVSSEQLDRLILKLWEEKGVYTTLDILPITPEEAKVTHPFYLDLAEEGLIIFDKKGLMAWKIEQVKRKLREIGAVKVVEPGSGWYWILAPEPEMARNVEL